MTWFDLICALSSFQQSATIHPSICAIDPFRRSNIAGSNNFSYLVAILYRNEMNIVMQDRSPLLRLPAEILDIILQDVLSEPGINEYHTRVRWKRASWKQPQAVAVAETEYSKSSRPKTNNEAYTWKPWGRGRPNLSVLLACRQLYAQAHPHVFKEIWFVVNGFVSDRHKSPGERCFLGSLPLRDAFRACPGLCDTRNLSIKIQIDEHSCFSQIHTPDLRNVLFELPQTLSRQLRQLERIKITRTATQQRLSHLWVDERALLYRFGFLKANHVEILGFRRGTLDSVAAVIQSQARPIDLMEYLLQLLSFVYVVCGGGNGVICGSWDHLWPGVFGIIAYNELRRYFREFVGQGKLDLLLDYALDWAVDSFYDTFDTFMEGMILRVAAVKNSLVELLPSEEEVESAISWSQADVMELWIDKLVSLDRHGRFLQLEFRQRVSRALGRNLLSPMDTSSLETLQSGYFETLNPFVGRCHLIRNYMREASELIFCYRTVLRILRASY